MFLLQVGQKDFFKILAQQQYSATIKLNVPRAAIYDRSGRIALAFNREVMSAFVLPKQLTEKEKTLLFLQKNYPDVHKRITENPERHFLWVERHLEKEKLNELKEAGINDIQFIT
jgi:cell division protein FtsI/penicillin-binding protein 2